MTDRPQNCPSSWGVKEVCPDCGQFHLWVGYCPSRAVLIDKRTLEIISDVLRKFV